MDVTQEISSTKHDCHSCNFINKTWLSLMQLHQQKMSVTHVMSSTKHGCHSCNFINKTWMSLVQFHQQNMSVTHVTSSTKNECHSCNFINKKWVSLMQLHQQNMSVVLCCVASLPVTLLAKFGMVFWGVRLLTGVPDPMPKQTEGRSPRRALICLVIGNAVSPLQAIVWAHYPFRTVLKSERR